MSILLFAGMMAAGVAIPLLQRKKGNQDVPLILPPNNNNNQNNTPIVPDNKPVVKPTVLPDNKPVVKPQVLPPVNKKVIAPANNTVAPTTTTNNLLTASTADKVKAIQTFLQQQGLYTRKIDGKWGSGTDTALRVWSKKTGKGVIGKTTINEWLQLMNLVRNSSSATVTNNATVTTTFNLQEAERIADAIIKEMRFSLRPKVDTILRNLKAIPAGQYASVSRFIEAKTIPRKTLVNYLLSSNSILERDKQAIRAEFERMGLRWNSTTSQWNLSGLQGNLKTNKATFVKDQLNRAFQVQQGTLLGTFEGANEGIAYFKDISGVLHRVPAQDTYLV